MKKLLYQIVAFTHALWVLFIVGLVPLIPIGNYFHWRWITLPWIRNIHLAAITFVMIQILFRFPCPLTTLECYLKGTKADFEKGFIYELWLNTLKKEPPIWLLNSLYYSFFGAILLLYFLIPVK